MNKTETKTPFIGQIKKELFKLSLKNEASLVLITVVLAIIIGSINPRFFSVNIFYGTMLATVVWGILGLGVGIVMINGGVDISSTTISIFSAYTGIKIMQAINPNASIILLFLIAMAIGAVLGLVNGLFISIFNVPVFFATLATSAIYKGVMLEYIGNIYITPAQMPQSTLDFSRTYVLGGLHISVLLLLTLIILSNIILRYTILGRGVYALGGAPESAQRIGYKLNRLKLSIYAYAGMLYGIAGVVYVANSRLADPYDMIGTRLTVIAIVVLGGVSLLGGKGSVWGVFFGALLSVIIRNNLILIGITSDWANFVFGLIFIGAVVLQSINNARAKRLSA